MRARTYRFRLGCARNIPACTRRQALSLHDFNEPNFVHYIEWFESNICTRYTPLLLEGRCLRSHAHAGMLGSLGTAARAHSMANVRIYFAEARRRTTTSA